MSATPSVFDKPLDGDINDVAEGLAILVDGDTAPRAISSGQYLFIKNHTTLATGGYHASSAIASGATISSSNVTVDADGIANSLNSSVTALNSKMLKKTSKSITFESDGNAMLFNATDSQGKLVVGIIIEGTNLPGYPAPWTFRAWNTGIWYARALTYASGDPGQITTGTYPVTIYYFEV